MRLTEAIRSALSAIGANALRSLLTMLGIVIGVAAVIAMVAIGAGARNLVDRQIRSLGANLAIVTPGNVTQGGARLGAGAASTLTDEDAAAIKREIEGVVAAAPFVRGTTQAIVRRQQLGHGASTPSTSTGSPPANGTSRTAAASIRRRSGAARSSCCSARRSRKNLFGEEDPIDRGRPRPQRALPGHRRHGLEGPVAPSARTRTTRSSCPSMPGAAA